MKRVFSPLFLILSLALSLALNLSACAPEFDWREVKDETGFRAEFPAGVKRMSRNITLRPEFKSTQVQFHQTAARVGRQSFSVGVLTHQQSQPTVLAEWLETALKMPLNAKVLERNVLALGPYQLSATQVLLQGEKTSKMDKPETMRLLVRFISTQNRIYELIVAAPAAQFKREEAEQFLNSFSLSRP